MNHPARRAVAIVIALAASACSNKPPENPQDYVATVAAERARKDEDFKAAANSPVPPNRRTELVLRRGGRRSRHHAHAYDRDDASGSGRGSAKTPVQPRASEGVNGEVVEYQTSASLIPSEDETIIEVPTSTGTIRKMRRLGTMEFTLKGQLLKLAAVIEVGARDANRLSVLFTDLTSGSETYPGGRYIDLDRTPSGYYEVDFNRAYFPYCYYSPTYECPYPPAENRLKVPVRAGERFKVKS